MRDDIAVVRMLLTQRIANLTHYHNYELGLINHDDSELTSVPRLARHHAPKVDKRFASLEYNIMYIVYTYCNRFIIGARCIYIYFVPAHARINPTKDISQVSPGAFGSSATSTLRRSFHWKFRPVRRALFTIVNINKLPVNIFIFYFSRLRARVFRFVPFLLVAIIIIIVAVRSSVVIACHCLFANGFVLRRTM